MTHTRRLATLILLFAPLAAGAKDNPAPPTPYLDRGACPFECCTYREWTTEQPTLVRKAMRDDAPAAFQLSKGEKVKGLTGVVITTRPGRAKLMRPMSIGGHQAPAGAVVYLLTYQGEGFYKAWYDGEVVKDLDFTDERLIKVTTQPEAVWWVKVRNGKGQTGWTNETKHFGNMDACG